MDDGVFDIDEARQLLKRFGRFYRLFSTLGDGAILFRANDRTSLTVNDVRLAGRLAEFGHDVRAECRCSGCNHGGAQ